MMLSCNNIDFVLWFTCINLVFVQEVVLKRKIYDKLFDWKNTLNGDTALLIDGARRVGKSYIAENFAKEN